MVVLGVVDLQPTKKTTGTRTRQQMYVNDPSSIVVVARCSMRWRIFLCMHLNHNPAKRIRSVFTLRGLIASLENWALK